LSAGHHQEIRRNYAAMIENVDSWLGRLVDRLSTADQLDDTVVIYASDHGEMLGDRGLWEKHVPWHPSVNVPLVVAGPGFNVGLKDSSAVSLTDLAATIRSIARVDGPDGVDGRPLVPGATGRQAAISGLGTWRMASDGRYALIAGYDPTLPRKEMTQGTFDPKTATGQLYDLSADPGETRDIAAEYPALVARFMARIADSMRA
jgi:arylsulfatase A-like enzyme